MKLIKRIIKYFKGTPKCNHLFEMKDIMDMEIDPICQSGCGKSLSELTPDRYDI